MEHDESNVLLILMCLDLNDPNPLRARRGETAGKAPLLNEGKNYHLLAAVLDPSHRTTSAPITGIDLNDSLRETYNSVLEEFWDISNRFYRKGGFVDEPESYTEESKAGIAAAMSKVGHMIRDLFPHKNAIGEWLDQLLASSAETRPTLRVTVVTNDFNVPWFWLKSRYTGKFLCEACSLGLLQLSAVGPAESRKELPGRNDRTYEALLIKGSTNLPFQDEELGTISSLLSDPDKRAARTFVTHRAETKEDIYKIVDLGDEKLLNDFRIVHFSGHYSGEKLHLSGSQMPLSQSTLKDILDNSLLVLDGCSSARGLDAWTDVEGLTSSLINKGTLGCVVTVLPVKHDPIASDVFWGAFYRELRRSATTVGQALVKARLELKRHFFEIGAKNNPAWAVYQLIGSPAVQLCDEEDEGNG